MPPELLTTSELSEQLDVDRADLLAFVQEGRIRPVAKLNREYVFSVPSVVAAIRQFHAERAEAEAVAS